MSDLNESGKLLPTMYLIVFPIYYIKPLPIFFIYNLSLYVQGIVGANSCKADTTSLNSYQNLSIKGAILLCIATALFPISP